MRASQEDKRALELKLQRMKKQLAMLDTVLHYVEDLTLVASVFLGIGIFGGVERGSIAEWKLIPCLVLIVVANLAYRLLTRRD